MAPNELKHLHYLVMADVLNVPIDSQQARLASVWRRYSAYAARTQKSIGTLSKAMRSMERAIEIKTSQFECSRLQANIASHQMRIDAQKQLLADYAQKKATESAKCPRCKATGVIPKTQRSCDSCDGMGEFRTTEADWKASLLTAALQTHKELITRHWPAILRLLQ
ncbi:TIGR02642 family protein, partial [Vibrio anguillarum]|uniref:TIGR02642 family protein n=1 Tax=Vibrio anguillarum TaxID=55601 RepID=UPI002E19A1A7